MLRPKHHALTANTPSSRKKESADMSQPGTEAQRSPERAGNEAVPGPRARPVRHFGQWIVAAVVAYYFAGLLYSLYENKNIDHSVIGDYLVQSAIMDSLFTTLKISIVSALLGCVLGVVIAVCRLSGNRILAYVSWLYIWFFRGSPLLVQLLIWGNFALLFKHVGLGVPFTDVTFFSFDTNTVITPFVAAVLGLGLNEGAYMAEVVRGGILAVGPGQVEAAKALGMGSLQTTRRIVLPQALRVIIPPTGNQFINLIKASSLVSVIAGGDLLTSAQTISSLNLKTIELLTVATFWYLVIVTAASIGQYFLERRVGRGR